MKSYVAKPHEIERKWYLLDAEGQTLGRFASQVAAILRGKNKPEYTPFEDAGDYVIIINAEKIAVTGNKAQQKIYRRHSGYMGGMKEVSYEEMLQKHPERILGAAIKGMLPHNSLGRKMYKKLKIYVGSEHPHSAQCPEVLELRF